MIGNFRKDILEKKKSKKLKMKARIIERTNVDGNKTWVIQQKHFLFRWWWVDAWINSSAGASCQDTFSSLDEAIDNLCYFDNSKVIDKEVIRKEITIEY